MVIQECERGVYSCKLHVVERMNVRAPRAERKERFNSAKDFARWPVVLATLQPQQQQKQQQWPIHHPSNAKQKLPQEKEKKTPITNEPKRSVSSTTQLPPLQFPSALTTHSLHDLFTQTKKQWRTPKTGPNGEKKSHQPGSHTNTNTNLNSNTTVQAGDTGIFVTCHRGKEGKCTGEVLDLLQDYAERIYSSSAFASASASSSRSAAVKEDGEDDGDGDGDAKKDGNGGEEVVVVDDIEKEILAEVREIRKPKVARLFTPVQLNVQCGKSAFSVREREMEVCSLTTAVTSHLLQNNIPSRASFSGQDDMRRCHEQQYPQANPIRTPTHTHDIDGSSQHRGSRAGGVESSRSALSSRTFPGAYGMFFVCTRSPGLLHDDDEPEISVFEVLACGG